MKKILTLLVLSISLITNANEAYPKAILVSNQWKLDIEKTIGLNMGNKQQNKSTALKKFVSDLNFTFEFSKDNKMVIKIYDLEVYQGIYNIKKQKEKDILTQELGYEKFQYEIVSIQKERIILRPINETDNITLIPIEKSNIDLETTLISKEWKMDSKSIENVLLKMEADPNFPSVSDEEKKATISATEIAVKGVRFIFMKDSKLSYKVIARGVELVNLQGTFIINKEKNEITIYTEMEPNQVYKIISMNKDKIHLKHIQRDNDLILVPSK